MLCEHYEWPTLLVNWIERRGDCLSWLEERKPPKDVNRNRNMNINKSKQTHKKQGLGFKEEEKAGASCSAQRSNLTAD